MSKRLASWMAWSFLGWAGFAHALGLGEIESQSRLNQKVSATIPILSASGGELDSLSVSLAGNDDFDRAGMERGEFLSTLRFVVENGTIKVSSKQIAREPFVSFLLDVRWDGGRLLREYTLLLDPPMLARGTGISAPKVTPLGEAQAPTVPEAPVEQAPMDSGAAEPAPEAPAEAAAAPAEAPPSGPAEGGDYGPVAPQETLWSIAYKLRPDPATITMDQMQVAIFNANPKAFHNSSIRGLMKGSMLRIPNADEIRAVDAASAKQLVAQAREGSPTIAAAPPPAFVESAPVESTPPPAEEAPPPAPPEPAPSTAEQTPPPPTSEAAPPSEAAPSGTPPPSETPESPPADTTPAPTPAPVEPAPGPETRPVTPPAPVSEGPGMVDTVLESVKGLTDNEYARYGLAAIVGVILLFFGGRAAKNKLAQMQYNRASKQAEVERTGGMPTIGSEDVTQVAGEPPAPSTQAALDSSGEEPTQVSGAKLSATVAMGSDTMQQTMQQTQVQEPPQAATGGRGVDFDVTSNFASETVQINLDAGDPLSEAEFHRAYGLYDEAALMLKQALQKDPGRTDARVKLAEIYFEAGKANEFVETAKELKGQLPADKWQPIALMGSQIAPNNELFSGAGGTGGTVDLSFDEPSAPSAPSAPETSAEPAAPAAPAGDSLEFDLGSLSLDTPAPAPAEPAPAAAPAAPAGDSLEFDLGSLSLDTPAAAPAEPAPAPAPPAAEPAAGGDLSLDLGDFDLNAGDAAPAAPEGGEVVELSSEPLEEPVVGDEAGTKLDLARAYLDMGDADMAKSLLNEVAQQGNDAQKKEAEELLKRASA